MRIAEVACDEYAGELGDGKAFDLAKSREVDHGKSRRGDQRRAYGFALQPRRRLEQPTAAFHPPALEPEQPAVAIEARAQADFPSGKALARAGAAEAEDLPAEVARVAGKPDLGVQPCKRAVEHDGLLRQPLERSRNLEAQALLGPGAGRAIPLARARRGKERVRALAGDGRELERVAACDARRRMHDDGVADAVAFGIEGLLHDERAVVTPLGEHRALAAALEAEPQLGLPGLCDGLGELHAAIIPPAAAGPRPSPCRRPRRARRSRRAP